MRKPTKAQVAAAHRSIAREDARARKRLESPERRAIEEETARRARLPSEHPEHICGRSCDGQDGSNSYCARLREKLFGAA